MSVYDDATRLAIMAIQDDNVAAATAAGILFNESTVRLAVATMTGGSAAAGIPGTLSVAYTAVTPMEPPDLRDQLREGKGQTLHVGDALLALSRSITRAQLLGASWIEIDGEKFTVVTGELRKLPFSWAVVLKRMQA